MKLNEFGAGKITAQNTTKDVKPGETQRQAVKFGNKIGKDGKPPLLHKTAAKNSDPNKLFNMGLTEDSSVNNAELERMIRASAKARGIDPDTAVKVWRSEGGSSYQSKIPRKGSGSDSGREASYGPFQLYTGGGLGNEYQDKYGVDLRKDNTPDGIKRQIDFALDKANEKGWAPWYGAEKAGVTGRAGLGNKPVYNKASGFKDGNIDSVDDVIDVGKEVGKRFVKGVKSIGSIFDDENLEERSLYQMLTQKLAPKVSPKTYEKAAELLHNIIIGKLQQSKGKLKHGLGYYAQQIGKQFDGLDYRALIAYYKDLYGMEGLTELKIQKPDEKDTLGIERKYMPQIKTADYPEFIEYLEKNGARFKTETIPAADLKAMQKEFSDKGILKQLEKNLRDGPNTKAVIASSDDYILDGHHRWLVALNTGDDLNVYRVNMPAAELYDLVNKFGKTYYKDIYDEGAPSIGVPLASGLVVSIFPHRPLKIKKSTPGKLNYNEDITQVDLNQLEAFADKLFAKVGIDVEFTRHFLDRVNDERNEKPITPAELTRLFKQEYKRWGKPIAQMGPDQEAVMKDLQTNINLPFALRWDSNNDELDLIAKTVMRKKDFKTPNREFAVESVDPILAFIKDKEKTHELSYGNCGVLAIALDQKFNVDQFIYVTNPAEPDKLYHVAAVKNNKIYDADGVTNLANVRARGLDDDYPDEDPEVENVPAVESEYRYILQGTDPDISIEDLNESQTLGQMINWGGKHDKPATRQIKTPPAGKPYNKATQKEKGVLDKVKGWFTTEELDEDLRDWFKEKWVNIGKKNKDGSHPECGTSGGKKGYAKCVPAAKAKRMSKKEKASATRRKRAAQNQAGRGGKDKPGSGKKPIRVSTKAESINETFDNPYRLKATSYLYSSGKWDVKAYSDTHEMVFKANRQAGENPGPGAHWTYEFGTRPIHKSGMLDYDKTGEGDAQRILATAVTALKAFIDEVEPAMITFTADKGDDGASRTKLYQRMVQRLAPQMGFKPIVQKGDSMDTFTLVKEAWSAKYKKSIDCSNPKGFSQRAHCAGRKKTNESFVKPQFDREWDEAARYPEFVKIGKEAWIELASKGKAVEITDASDINNTEAADPDAFSTLDSAKQKRALAQLERGVVEMPIVAVYSDGYKELIGGNTRLTAMMAKDGKATVWQFEVPDEVANLAQEQVEEAQVDEGVNDPHIFKAVFLAGGPGSGKSFVSDKILGGTGLRTVNSDEVFEFLMKKQGFPLDDPASIFSPQGQEIRGRAKELTDNRMHTYLKGRIGLLIDGTGKDVDKYAKQVEKLGGLGYDCAMIFVNTSHDVAQQRNQSRERQLPAAVVTQLWNAVQDNMMKFQQIFGAGRFHILDNSGGLEDIDRQKNFDKVYVEMQRFLNTPPSKRAATRWFQQQKAQSDEKRSAQQQQTTQSDGGTETSN